MSGGTQAEARKASAGPKPVSRRLSSPIRALPLPESVSGGNGSGKALFKSKPRTPVDLVRQTRELLIYVERGSSSDVRESKREEKVRFCSLCMKIDFIFFNRESNSIPSDAYLESIYLITLDLDQMP